MEAGKPLPPVVLYKLGYGYYVLDGNHRVAAAKQLGQLEIEAPLRLNDFTGADLGRGPRNRPADRGVVEIR